MINIFCVMLCYEILGELLGEGAFSKVRRGIHTQTQKQVAVKVMSKDSIQNQEDVERIQREIAILTKIKHPNIIQLLDFIETEEKIYLVMEHAENGELFDYIVEKQRLDEVDACRIIQQMLSGIEYLHETHGICHRDLKPENLLLDYNNNIKIVDFGLSNIYQPDELLKTACGSPCYAAPEMIQNK